MILGTFMSVPLSITLTLSLMANLSTSVQIVAATETRIESRGLLEALGKNGRETIYEELDSKEGKITAEEGKIISLESARKVYKMSDTISLYKNSDYYLMTNEDSVKEIMP